MVKFVAALLLALLCSVGCGEANAPTGGGVVAVALARGRAGVPPKLLRAAVNVLEVGDGYQYGGVRAALAAAVPGDLIVVYPGLYLDSSVIGLRDRVDLYCYEGVRVENNRRLVSQDEGTVFWDLDGAVTCGIYGHGVFVNDTGYLGESFALDLRNGSTVYIEADSLIGYAMALEVDHGSRMEVVCPAVVARVEHGIRTRNGGYVHLTGNLYSLDERHDGGGQAVYFQGNSDTVIVDGDVFHDGGYGAVFCGAGDTGTFVLNGNLASAARAIWMIDGSAYLSGSRVSSHGAIVVERLFAKNCRFVEETGADYVFGAGSGDTADFSNCSGNAEIDPLAVWYGRYMVR